MIQSRFFVPLLFAFAFSSCLNQAPKGVVIEMQSPDLPDSTAVFITGSIPQLGNWNPNAVKMKALGKHVWQFQLSDSIPDLVEYKFTLGSWEKEAAGANGLPLQNLILKAKGDTTVRNTIYFWLDGKPKTFNGQITGKVEYHRQLHGDSLIDRDLVVLLPNDYASNNEKHYPVLYMHDGQNIFDPATSSFGVDWQIDETLDSMSKIGNREIPIVVGIYNTIERTPDYTIGQQSQDYMAFVVDIVKPFIDKHYRTKPQKEFTSIGGSSYGGLISFRLAWEYPDVFSKAYCLSPALKVQNIDYVKNVREGGKPDVVFYLDNGGIGLEEQLQPGIDEMIAALKQKGYIENKDFFWVHDKSARHFESDWAKRMPKAFELMLEKK